MNLTLTNAQLVLPTEVVRGHLQIANGRIAGIDQGTVASPTAVDLQGDLLIPGMIEIHTDNFERHLMPRPKVRWDECAALIAHDAEVAACGITTVLDALGVGEADPDSLRGSEWRTVLQHVDALRAQNAFRADHLLHVRCELPAPNTIELFQPFVNRSDVLLISLMDHTPGQRQWENIDHARVYFTGKKGWSEAKFLERVTHSKQLQTEFALPHRAYFVDHCATHHIALASHDDTTVAHVDMAHSEGAVISEFPTTQAAAERAHNLGLHTVMGGPNVVRGGSHSGNVSATELAKLGLVDILSSDYVPGSLLTAVAILVQRCGFGWPQAMAMVSGNPAKSLGLLDRGHIQVGLRADLVQVRMVPKLDSDICVPVIRAVWRQGVRVA